MDAGQRPLAIYTGVPPGEYVFQLRGAGSGGVWSEPTTLRLSVRPAFYETGWFKGLVVALVIALLAGAYYYRVHHLLEVERTRRRIASDLHDDIGSRISTFALQADLMSHYASLAPQERDRLAEMAQQARQTVQDLRDTVWLVHTGHDRLSDLLARMEQIAATMLQGREHRIRVPDGVPEADLDMETRRHVLMIFKEALHNAVRHSEAPRVEVDVTVQQRTLRLCISDNGRGFERGEAVTGHGLASMHERARRLGGSLQIDSAPQAGTTVSFSVNII